jgi:hypothetical protein
MTDKKTEQALEAAGINLEQMEKVDTELDNYPDHDFDKEPVAYGTIVKIKEAQVPRRKGNEIETVDTRLMILESPAGRETVWESANLVNLFDKAAAGQQVVLRFTHKEPLDGGRSMRMFEVHLSR